MQHSDVELNPSGNTDDQPGQSLAVTAEVLYLLNLLLFPVIAFILLLFLYKINSGKTSHLAECHLKQTVFASIWAGIMLVIVNALIIFLGGYGSAYTWLIVITYFITIHATFIFLGTYGLARAMTGKHYHYPVVGGECPGKQS